MGKNPRTIYKSDIKEAASRRYRNQAGFLVLPECVLARSGILQYADVEGQDGKVIADGQVISVLRPATALEQAAAQFANLPLTIEHPESQKVDPANAKEVVVGALGSDPRYVEKDGIGYIICDIIVYDENAISKIENGEYQELSAGYETAFRQERGMDNGEQYEAVQFLLVPNHVALVEKGRCGGECRVCDSRKTQSRGAKQMAKKRIRYAVQVGDSYEEISEDLYNELKDKPDTEVEEVSEEDFKEKLDGCHGGVKDEEFEETEEEKDFEEIEDEDEDEDFEEFSTEETETEDEDGSEEMVYEVQFDDGTTGKMDKNAYEHVARFLEVTAQKGDAAEAIAQATLLTSTASRIIGDSFDAADYISKGHMDYDRIKRDVIKKVMPSLVTMKLKGDALEQVYQTAVSTARRNKSDWKRDIAGLSSVAKADREEAKSPVQVAREKYLARQK